MNSPQQRDEPTDLEKAVALENNSPIVRKIRHPEYEKGYDAGYHAGIRKAESQISSAVLEARIDQIKKIRARCITITTPGYELDEGTENENWSYCIPVGKLKGIQSELQQSKQEGK